MTTRTKVNEKLESEKTRNRLALEMTLKAAHLLSQTETLGNEANKAEAMANLRNALSMLDD